ncbi:MAG TPA: homocysteine S-methyltransferase family protein [Aggregatilineales bacterium]|nr:homocysteine S-methyltransferase family protein [Aggregatilineales bacterium]
MTAGILERLKNGIVLGAEGYLFELERRGYVQAGPYVPEVVLDAPDAVRELHREFLRAGAEVMVAFTYYAHKTKLRTIGREADLEKLNRQALRLAREVAQEGDVLLAGNICNTWEYDPANAEKSGAVVREMYREQVKWAVEEGANFIISETNDYLGEALIGLEVIQEFKLPAMVTFASTAEATIDGYSFPDACKALEDRGCDIVGLNCSRGPETLLPLLDQVRSVTKGYVAVQPVPYHTTPEQPTFQSLKDRSGERAFPVALDPFLCTRFEMADFARVARQIGANYIGICCGGAPHYVRAMAEALGRTPPASRYSPRIALHPVLGTNVEERHTRFKNWKD